MQPLLSIVIPMYKVEPYIRQCLDSIVCQLPDDESVELIAINDGSPDKSGEIAKSYRQVRLINQKNSGLSAARNSGLSEAAGEYVWFIDSDDWIAGDAIKTILAEISSRQPEAIHICGADVVEDKPQKLFSLAAVEGHPMTGLQMLRSNNFHGVVQYTVYRRDFLNRNNLKFFTGIYHEDTEFSPKAYYYLKDVVSVDKVLYLKRVNDDSITRTVNPKKNYDLIKVSRSLRDFAQEIPDEADRKYFMRLASNAFKMAMTNETRLMDKKTRKEFNKHLYQNADLLKSFFNSDRFLSKIEGTLLSVFSRNMLMVNNGIFQNKILRRFS